MRNQSLVKTIDAHFKSILQKGKFARQQEISRRVLSYLTNKSVQVNLKLNENRIWEQPV